MNNMLASEEENRFPAQRHWGEIKYEPN